MFEYLDYLGMGNNHRYSLAATGVNFKSKEFSTRREAESAMHKFMNKNGIRLNEIYDDKHYKTYCCEGGVKFYINRI